MSIFSSFALIYMSTYYGNKNINNILKNIYLQKIENFITNPAELRDIYMNG